MSRYKIVEGSQSAHCCFGYTIVDITKPVMNGDLQWRDQFEPLCECFELQEAETIVNALNKSVEI